MKRINGKRSQNDLYSTLGSIVLVLVLVVIGFIIFKGNVEAATRTISPFEVDSRNKACKIGGERILGSQEILKEEIEGSNGDKFPDDCDMCLGGDNNKISNSRGIPDACYAETSLNQEIKTYKDMCKARSGCYISDTSQCCIGESKSRCESKFKCK